jgi:hypothetical protein
LPPPLTAIDPAARLGFDLSSLRTVEDLPQVLATVLAAVARGDIAPAEAAHIAERAAARLRAARRQARRAESAEPPPNPAPSTWPPPRCGLGVAAPLNYPLEFDRGGCYMSAMFRHHAWILRIIGPVLV